MTDISPTPLWTPSAAQKAASHIVKFAKGQGFSETVTYDELHHWSVAEIGAFWSSFWDYAGVIGDKGDQTLSGTGRMETTKFFPNGTINWAENLLKRRDDKTAIIFRDELKREREITFKELAGIVSRIQQALIAAGIQKGDRVAGYMPNMPETIMFALAASSLGAIWSSASPDFGVQGVIDRLGQIEPKILISVDGYYYNGKVIEVLPKLVDILPKLPTIQKTIIVPFTSETPDLSSVAGALSFHDFIAPFAVTEPKFERVPFNHPLFIMFSSGTTGIPKCIIHGHGGTLLQHMKEHQLQCDIHEDDKVFYFTTCGWMMWNWQISALASGATLMLYDGSPFYPDAYALWEYTSKHGCMLFGTGAKYIDALKAHNCVVQDKFDLKDLRVITSTGSPLVHESFDYVYATIKKDVHLASISGGTDIVSCFVIGNPISPVYRGEIQGAGLGYAIEVYDDQGHPMAAGAGSGELVCTQPFPCMPVGFWNDPAGEKYHKAYFDRFDNIWCHGDWIEKTIHGGFIILGRSDATLNPGGVRIGTAEIYRQVEQIPEVLESIAVGQLWDNDERVILFVRLKDNLTLNDDIIARIKSRIKSGASPRHVPAKILQVADIPRTKSNKIVELAVKEVIHNRAVKNIEALANPEALNLYKDLAELKV
ncbi:MAG: acetoacetate--CoA ligase [Alphaproteobacteria bacterium RIFCSPHIGHO2_12_FULL_45_9]|nr:MAG: acetoacetate--CoA ligase [Alphaproteobacteria bacterium RIFCSPHIGHO2_02_FULL_46_13]OFW96249.1 MAG: acetoacetate--CoA ligase [Alphaproteobacteria bacterium RIFCSPHIGHO2_12_FULL_45_9]